jgi:hypothetical protein
LNLIEVVRSLRPLGVNLEPRQWTSSDWSEFRREKIGPFTVVQLIPTAVWSGYSTGVGTQQVSSDTANRLGIVIQIFSDQPEGIYSEQVLENTDFLTQQQLWKQVVSEINSLVYPTSSFRDTGTRVMENPLSPDGDSWRPGDVVNVSRPSQDGGGLTLGHVVRIYPTSAMIEWPADALHPQPWTTEEKKTSLIFVSHDAAWTREKEFSAESYYHPLVNPYSTNSIEDELSIESQMSGPAPKWAANARPVGIDFYRPNPLPRSQDVWGENDAIMKYVNSVVASAITAPKLPDLTPEELQDSQTLPEDY